MNALHGDRARGGTYRAPMRLGPGLLRAPEADRPCLAFIAFESAKHLPLVVRECDPFHRGRHPSASLEIDADARQLFAIAGDRNGGCLDMRDRYERRTRHAARPYAADDRSAGLIRQD